MKFCEGCELCKMIKIKALQVYLQKTSISDILSKDTAVPRLNINIDGEG